jgi:branched-chain amino acid transport system substrate-binding protein
MVMKSFASSGRRKRRALVGWSMAFALVAGAACGSDDEQTADQPASEATAPEVSGTEATIAPEQPATSENAAPASPTVDKVLIAAPISLTGPAASFGEEFSQGMNHMTKWINEHGGVKSLGGAPIELIVGDTQSDPQQAVRLIREMQGQGAVGTIGPIGSAEAFATLATLKQLKFPFVSVSADEDLAVQGEGYVYRIIAGNDGVIGQGADFLNNQAQEHGFAIEHLGVVSVTAAPGPAYDKGWTAAAERQGWEVSSYTYNPAETKSLASLIEQMKNDGVDTAVGLIYPQDSVLFMQDMAAQSWRPANGFYFQFGGPPTPFFREAAGQNGLNWLSSTYFAAGSGCPEQAEFHESFEAEYGFPLENVAAIGAATVAAFYGALEAAAEATPEAVLAAMPNVEMEDCGVFPLRGGLAFDEIGNNEAWTMPVIQNEGDPLTGAVVWPAESATRPPVWPAHDLPG